MKFLLCRSCQGFAVPSKPPDGIHLVGNTNMPVTCPCGLCAIMYTGDKLKKGGNEVGIIGPSTLLAIPDEAWHEILQADTRGVYNIFTLAKTATTVIEAEEDAEA